MRQFKPSNSVFSMKRQNLLILMSSNLPFWFFMLRITTRLIPRPVARMQREIITVLISNQIKGRLPLLVVVSSLEYKIIKKKKEHVQVSNNFFKNECIFIVLIQYASTGSVRFRLMSKRKVVILMLFLYSINMSKNESTRGHLFSC